MAHTIARLAVIEEAWSRGRKRFEQTKRHTRARCCMGFTSLCQLPAARKLAPTSMSGFTVTPRYDGTLIPKSVMLM